MGELVREWATASFPMAHISTYVARQLVHGLDRDRLFRWLASFRFWIPIVKHALKKRCSQSLHDMDPIVMHALTKKCSQSLHERRCSLVHIIAT